VRLTREQIHAVVDTVTCVANGSIAPLPRTAACMSGIPQTTGTPGTRPIVSATSASVALFIAAPRAWEAMHPSQRTATAIASARSSLVFLSTAPSANAAECIAPNPS